MNDPALLALVTAAIVGLLAVVAILRRRSAADDNPLASSTEGEKVCPRCGMGNLWTDRTCISCGASLRG
jgi:hypothetical protein